MKNEKQLHSNIDKELKAEYDHYLKSNGIRLRFHIEKLIKNFLIEEGVYQQGGVNYHDQGGEEKND